MRNRWFTAVIFAAGLAAAPWFLAAPQAQAAEASISSMSVSTLRSILEEWGATDITEGNDESMVINDQVTLTIKVMAFKHNGLVHYARTFCHPAGGCVGLRVTCAFEDGGASLATLNGYNANYRAGKAFQAPHSQVARVNVSERYIILDYGVARANILVQLNVYANYTQYLLEHIKNATIAAAPGGTTTPVALKRPVPADAAMHAAAANQAFEPHLINKVP